MNETTYFVANTQETEDGRAQSLFAYDDRMSAESAYHSTCASNYESAKAGTLKSFAVALLNVKLYPEVRDTWTKPEPIPEPTED